jgi:hypothetical protein
VLAFEWQFSISFSEEQPLKSLLAVGRVYEFLSDKRS